MWYLLAFMAIIISILWLGAHPLSFGVFIGVVAVALVIAVAVFRIRDSHENNQLNDSNSSISTWMNSSISTWMNSLENNRSGENGPVIGGEIIDSPIFPHAIYEFQKKGVAWLLNHNGALLADDMGLGKTVQAIVAMRYILHTQGDIHALVVCPKSVLSSWAHHFREWAPGIKAVTIAGTPEKRMSNWALLKRRKAHVGIITYASLRNDIFIARKRQYNVIVLDEVQNVKNAATQQTQAVRLLDSKVRWGLSGTPLENSVDDLLQILDTLDPKVFPVNSVPIWMVKSATKRMMIRRRKEEVLKDLPPIHSSIEYLQLTDEQRRAYDMAEREGVAQLQDGTLAAVPGVLALITRLKQICNGVNGHSAKLDWLTDYLSILETEGDKALVFSQYVATLATLESRLARFQPLIYTGAMAGRARDRAVDAFQRDSAHTAMLLSVRAGGTGLTLTAASRVIHFDSWWNPAVMAQATARAHRIGQKKPVFVTTLMTEDTIEERIQKLLERKRALFKTMVDDLSTTGLSGLLTERELYGLFNVRPPR